MPNNKTITSIIRRIPWAHTGYPAGVIAVFLCILLGVFFSYRFLTTMIDRATVLPPSQAGDGPTFHLEAYRKIAPSFGLLPRQKEEGDVIDRGGISLLLRNAQWRNDRFMRAQALLKDEGWRVTIAEGEKKEASAVPVTTISAKESRTKEMAALRALFLREGFVIREGAPLPKEDEHDIVITLGRY